YGNRGTNGVIVVTTKGGNFNQKMEIHYSSQYGLSEIMPLNMSMMSAKQKLTFMRNRGLDIAGMGIPGLSNNMSDAEIDAYTSGHNTNWEDVFFRTASYNRQDLTITTGSENTANATSINYLDQEGIFFATGLQ